MANCPKEHQTLAFLASGLVLLSAQLTVYKTTYQRDFKSDTLNDFPFNRCAHRIYDLVCSRCSCPTFVFPCFSLF